MAKTWRPVKNLKAGDIFDVTMIRTHGIYSMTEPPETLLTNLYGYFEVRELMQEDGDYVLVRGVGAPGDDPAEMLMVYFHKEQIVGLDYVEGR